MDNQDLELAEIAYRAYSDAVNAPGDELDFSDVAAPLQNAWRAAADAVVKELHRRKRADR